MPRRAFTLTDLLVVLGIVAVLVGVGLPVLVAMRRNAWRETSTTQLRGMHQGMVTFTQSSKYSSSTFYFPGLAGGGAAASAVRSKDYNAPAVTSDATLIASGLVWMMVFLYFDPGYAISPGETSSLIRPAAGGGATVTTRNTSYAWLNVADVYDPDPARMVPHLIGPGRAPALPEWSETLNADAIVLGDRASDNGTASIWSADRWTGTVVRNDNSTAFPDTDTFTGLSYGNVPAGTASDPAIDLFPPGFDHHVLFTATPWIRRQLPIRVAGGTPVPRFPPLTKRAASPLPLRTEGPLTRSPRPAAPSACPIPRRSAAKCRTYRAARLPPPPARTGRRSSRPPSSWRVAARSGCPVARSNQRSTRSASTSTPSRGVSSKCTVSPSGSPSAGGTNATVKRSSTRALFRFNGIGNGPSPWVSPAASADASSRRVAVRSRPLRSSSHRPSKMYACSAACICPSSTIRSKRTANRAGAASPPSASLERRRTTGRRSGPCGRQAGPARW